MNCIRKIVFKILLSLIGLFVFSAFISESYSAKALTRDEAMSWVISQKNRRYEDCDCDSRNGNEGSCVDLVFAYMNYCWQTSYGVSGEPWSIDPYCPPMAYGVDDYFVGNTNWTIIPRNSNTVPEPGDVFVSERNYAEDVYGRTGHVGIVEKAYGSTEADIIEMNLGDGKPPHSNHVTWGNNPSYDPVCFIRYNNFEQKKQEFYLDLNWKVDGKEVWNSDVPGTVDVYIDDKLVKSNADDYYEKWPEGTKFEFKNRKDKSGYEYSSVTGSIKGTLSSGTQTYPGSVQVYFNYKTKKATASSDWVKKETGTWTYWSIPSGFDKNHALYSKYNSKKLESTETSTKKVVAEAPVQSGWIYYHWTSNSYERSNYNIYISREYKWEGNREYYNFRAFESVNDHGHTDQNGIYGGDDVYYSWGDNPEDGSWWWFRIPLYKQTYTTYEKAAKQE